MIAFTDPTAVAALVTVTAFLLASAGLGKKRLVPKAPICPVCHHPEPFCTCRWK